MPRAVKPCIWRIRAGYTRIPRDQRVRSLLDLYGAVILFDEMDALVQSRDRDAVAGALDVTQKFLTTSMLPKLQKLRDAGRTLFFMATNHQEMFDPAIKRTGRFDLLVHMGPPSPDQKIDGLSAWSSEGDDKETSAEIGAARLLLREYIAGEMNGQRFGRLTFGEMREFLGHIRRVVDRPKLNEALEAFGAERFRDMLEEWATERITLSNGSAALEEFARDSLASRIQC